MHLPYGRGESRIGQPAQEPGRRVVSWRQVQRLDEQYFHEAREDEITA